LADLALGNEVEKCAIFLEEYQDDEGVSKLDRRHYYHDRCVRRWVPDSQPTYPLYEITLVCACVLFYTLHL
jgi:hypothetical protein